ncbi:hypothetical protein F2981_14870 [Sinorhizobium meliloti]|nr:hypothetical protein [Sinorhizobium meliloti]
MSAKIYRPQRQQCSPARPRRICGCWSSIGKTRHDRPIMGYTSSADTRQQVRLTFESAEQAIAYAGAMANRVSRGSRPRMRLEECFLFGQFPFQPDAALDPLRLTC